MKKLTRRDFLRLSAMTAAGAVAAACAQPTPMVIEKEVIREVPVEKPVVIKEEVIKEVPVEKVVEKEVVKEVQVEKIVEKEKIVEVEKASARQAPMLQEMVKSGELPPLEDRLPVDPLIEEPLEPGEYGGDWNHFIQDPSLTKINSTMTNDYTVRWTQDALGVEAGIAHAWEVSKDAKVFTFHLRTGMKYSDGQPFGADDYEFYWNDVALNDELLPVKPSYLLAGGELPKFEKVNDTTIRYTFSNPNPLFPERLCSTNDPYACKHYLKQFHPNYTSKEELDNLVKEEGFDEWYELFQNKNDWYYGRNPDLPYITAWFPTVEPPANRFIFERNPYYWKVDTQGRQLPYIDRVVADLVQDSEVFNLRTIAGEADMEWWETLMFTNYPLFMKEREKSDYQVLQWTREIGVDQLLRLNLVCNNMALRELYQQRDFRIALSVAIDREEINELIYFGVCVPKQATVIQMSPYYKEEFATAYAQFDSDMANELLDGLGLTEYEGPYRKGSDGKIISIVIETSGERAYDVDILELVSKYWADIGVKMTVKTLERTALRDRVYGGEADMSIWWMDGGFRWTTGCPFVPEVRMNLNAPGWGLWYATKGEEGEEPPLEMKRAMDLWDEFQVAMDEDERIEIAQEILKIQAENLWEIGMTGEIPHPIIVKNYFKNVPEKSLYSWTFGNFIGLSRAEMFFMSNGKE